jgi:hypothetical protein
MFGLVKIAGMSAVLAAGLVTLSEMPRAAVPGKAYTDRVAVEGEAAPQALAYAAPRATPVASESAQGERKGDRQQRPTDACSRQVWPHVTPSCMAEGGRNVRVVTLETRVGEATSALVRVPQPEMVQR